ncbi:amidohydrolase family protein [Aquirhabdus parva]|uniref:Amidohydrolase n=1 Tax=Aquirhabdus parva TaxID=2283318 RepID=A0A345P7M9_9GAMM|nr:amidohydrolase family protein [Aquirhabdus parva]AXI03288.1 amidohydrolase [Aquirhabdus parva]
MSVLSFPIIDPHIHQWNPYHTPHKAALLVKLLGRFPRLMDRTARLALPQATIDFIGLTEGALSPYLPANYMKDSAPFAVEAVVHIEADWHHHHGLGVVEETAWVSKLPFGHGHTPKLGAIIGKADPLSPHFDDILKGHIAASPLFRGIRCMAAHHSDPGVHGFSAYPHIYTNPIFLKRFERLAHYGLSFDAWAYSTQLPDVTYLAKQFPEIKFVIDHLATPVGVFGPVGRSTGYTVAQRAGILSQWKDDIAELAALPHVQAKVSGLLMPVLGHDFHKRHELASVEMIVNLLGPLVEHAYKVFGPERLIFASNFPMDKVTARLPDVIEAYAQLIAPYGESALKAVFRENAIRFYGLKI